MTFRRSIDSLAADFCRRRFLLGALGSGAALAHAPRLLAAEFWNAKDPSTWTEEEINILTSKSPWARAAVPGIKHADDPTESAGGGGGAGGMGGGGGGGRATFRRATINVIVRWESAQPILDALRAPLAADFAGHYVLSVTNLPIPPRRTGRGDDGAPDEELERMQNGATLQVRDKGTAEAGIVRRTRIGSILFGFSKDLLRLSPSDREIFFTLDTEIFVLKAKFDGKEMVYHGKLAV
ncbi:MAG: hypothetical protein ABSB15_18645 [Bryobacteraceae bacterium]|jgi:hypothetical protein